MDVMVRVLSVVIGLAIIGVWIAIWIYYLDGERLVRWMNGRIKGECDEQDKKNVNGIPSYQTALECSNKVAMEFNQLITLNYEEIINEVEGINSKEDIRIRYLGKWCEGAEKVPTLKKVANLFPDVINLYISFFNPGNTIIEKKEEYRGLQKYHFGLKIPKGDLGLRIGGYDVKWKEKEGFVWDETLEYSEWNHTSETRVGIYASIFRDLSSINSLGSKLIYNMIYKRDMATK